MITTVLQAGNNLKMRADFNGDLLDAETLLKKLLITHRPDVLEFLKRCRPDKDMAKYENGIDSWWGLGSVMLWELGLVVTVEYSCIDGVKLNISA